MVMIGDILKSAVNNVKNSKEEFNKEEWGKAKQQDREFAYQTQDEMATKITENGELYKTYLNVQSRFPTYSVGNALLVMAQNPNARQLKDADSWKREHIYFAGKPNKIIILEQGEIYEREDGTEAQSYNPKNVYDISDMKVKKGLNKIPFSQENIMQSVLSLAQVEVTVVENTSNNKLVNFNVDKKVIEVSEQAEVEQTIRGLVREIASIHTFSYEESELNTFKNESVAYMICKRYGIPTKDFNFEKIPEELKQMTPQEIKLELGKGRECFEILSDKIDLDVGMQNRNKTNREYER
jgi:hypothetical protein